MTERSIKEVGAFHSHIICPDRVEAKIQLSPSEGKQKNIIPMHITLRKISMHSEMELAMAWGQNERNSQHEAALLHHQMTDQRQEPYKILEKISKGFRDPTKEEMQSIHKLAMNLIAVSWADRTPASIDEMVCYIERVAGNSLVAKMAMHGGLTRNQLIAGYGELKMQELENIAVRAGAPVGTARAHIRHGQPTDEQKKVIDNVTHIHRAPPGIKNRGGQNPPAGNA